ncbi:MAG: glutathione S-transferase [Pseudomonadales bacterium]|nr:MAG: glutathione S-transferase [Pseudomonadales bacterium]
MPANEKRNCSHDSAPLLYSFRRCPYAIRARMALCYAAQPVELREVLLRDKPASMLAFSCKGTVPVLVLQEQRGTQTILDESLDIIDWALQQQDPDNWRSEGSPKQQQRQQVLIAQCDSEFKYWLDRYKYADRYPQYSVLEYRAKAETFLLALERALQKNNYLCGEKLSRADIAIFPFIRQFANVERDWFDASEYHRLVEWLGKQLASTVFTAVMRKYHVWREGEAGVLENWRR